MHNDLMSSSPNRNKVHGIENEYVCAFCGKKCGIHSKGKRKITHNTVHMSMGVIRQFCNKNCKMNWIESKI